MYFFEYSADNLNWITGTTDSNLDACGTTAKVDTIGITQGVEQVNYQVYPYFRLKFVVGQAMNATVLTYTVTFKKPEHLIKYQCGSVQNRRTS
jgi:hypothetical protein